MTALIQEIQIFHLFQKDISENGMGNESGNYRSDKKFHKKERQRKIIDAFEKDNSQKKNVEEVK